MRRSPKLRPTAWDALVVLAVAALAVACALLLRSSRDTGDGLTAVVSIDGEEADRLDLAREEGERTYSHNGYTLTVDLRPDGEPGLRVVSSDCPTQDCVHTGTITRAGQSIVCLPARIIFQLEGGAPETDGGPDLVIG